MLQETRQTALTIPNDISLLPIVTTYVAEVAKVIGFTEEDIKKIQLGTEEAVTNILQHAFESGQEDTVSILCEKTPLGLKIILKEKGIPFDPSRTPEFDKEKLKAELSAQGLGTYIMKQFMDDVTFHNMGREGKETHLEKYLGTKNVQEYMQGASPEAAPESQHTPEKVDYTVRLMQPDEAVEVCKCAYMAYGYSYTHENIYYPERVRDLNRAESMISLIAVTADNEITGHIALVIDEHDNNVAEGGIAFVKPSFRGQGCLGRLLDAMMNEAEKRKLTGIYGNATATHAFSQKGVHKYGMRDCALFLSKLPPAEYKGIETAQGQRRSSMYCFKYLAKPEESVIYAPPQHKDMIQKIYANIDVGPTFTDPAPNLAGTKPAGTDLSVSVDNFMAAKIELHTYGDTAAEELSRLLKKLCTDRLETIYLYLNLSDPATAMETEAFEKLGFFFCGIVPGSQGKDRLVLQYLNQQVFSYDDMQIASNLGRELLDYIRDRDPNL